MATDLRWKNLDKYVSVSDHKKQILFKVSGLAKAGQLVALMGPSGSGKTTLLNVLGGRGLADLTGDVYINRTKFKKSMKRLIAYVLQEDIFYTNLTVREQLYFTSHLRLPDSLSHIAKRDAVNHVIKTLRIERCADTQILLVSGGERKRCNIGTELLTNPSILLLDEPTSGLDSTAANSLIVTLRALAAEQMTIITSIHQPSSKVFYAFDHLVLLADGHTVYAGAPSHCLAYFSGLGYSPPADYNPADFVMDLLSSPAADLTDAEADLKIGDSECDQLAQLSCQVIKARLIDAWESQRDKEIEEMSTSPLESFQAEQGNPSPTVSYRTQFFVLLERALKNSKAQKMSTLTVLQTLGMSVICGLVWFRMPYTERSINDRAGYVFFFQSYWFIMTLFQGMMTFLPERFIILKERSAGSYRLSAFFLSKTVSELPVQLLMPFLFLVISYPMSNLNSSVTVFFAVVGTQLLATLCGESVGIFIGTVTMDFEKAMVLATLASMALMLTGGFFAQRLPLFLKWFQYLSPFKYSYDACLQLVFDSPVPCDGGVVMAQCVGASTVAANDVLDYLSVSDSLPLNACLLILFLVAFRIAAYLSLRFLPHNSGRK